MEAEGPTLNGQIYVLQQGQISLIKWQIECEMALTTLICSAQNAPDCLLIKALIRLNRCSCRLLSSTTRCSILLQKEVKNTGMLHMNNSYVQEGFGIILKNN